MTQLPVYQIDAFTDRAFGGNPAAVMPLDAWLPDQVMQDIAMENNLSETAYAVARDDGDFDLRWMTPTAEVPLCGHATLATAWLVLNRLRPDAAMVRFHTKSGRLEVRRDGDMLVMDLPSLMPEAIPEPDGMTAALGRKPAQVLRAVKTMAVFESLADVLAVRPDLGFVEALAGDGLIVTAPGDDCDCVSRYFAPHVGIDEDPVTGSAHCTIVPYWARRLGKTDIHARQVSARGGDLHCQDLGERVSMAGHAVLFMEGSIHLP